ncbi:CRISPR-associated endoribonuclease Cas6 [Proteiniborus ethanoligenes]|uniref:CRISPR-associated endoribonuclease n=1 Tax=Proteiniborus ethanoligenes TaxID=415015 RepID=A0A1H3SNK5_9FIRM|nr:CRISPR-associated endoribonuclease Cas6 [Proteiniborus ethanoligenes]SDZ39290.1 CRISPR-associated endoribonuclease Cas6 [Proteiniborus ethanoligenes]
MYLKVILSSFEGEKIKLPLQYNYYVQSMIYKLLEKEMAEFLHEKGFELEKRRFKMFCFSQLMGNYKIYREKKEIVFDSQVDLYISSPMEEFLAQLSNSFLLNDNIKLCNNALVVKSVKIEKYSFEDTKVVVQTLAPVTVYSTLYKADGGKFTCYYNPIDKEFKKLVADNIYKKYKAYFEKEPINKEFSITAIGKPKLHVLNYKGILIKGYSGRFVLEGDRELIKLALNSGLGSKNSQGFGFIKLV